LLKSFYKHYKNTINYIDDLDIVITKRVAERDMASDIIIGEKMDKKVHTGVYIKIGEDVEKNDVFIQTNLTSKQNINLTNDCKVTLMKHLKLLNTMGLIKFLKLLVER